MPISLLRHPKNKGIALLVLTTFIWGSTFPISKLILNKPQNIGADALIAARFLVAALFFLPWLLQKNQWRNLALWRDALPISLLFYASYITQAIGLETISSNRAAFITGLNVILVPLIAALWGTLLSRNVIVAALLAFLGIGILSFEGAPLSLGDAWVFLCAVAYALYILLLEQTSARHNSLALTSAQLVIVAMMSGIGIAPKLLTQANLWPALINQAPAILYLALLATALTTFTQVLGQKLVPATQTAIIYALEPVFAAGFAFFLLHETLGWRGLTGGAIILVAMLVATLPDQKTITKKTLF